MQANEHKISHVFSDGKIGEVSICGYGGKMLALARFNALRADKYVQYVQWTEEGELRTSYSKGKS